MADNTAPNTNATATDHTAINSDATVQVFPNAPANYQPMNAQEATAATIVSHSEISSNAAPHQYAGGMSGSEHIAKQIVDANLASTQTTTNGAINSNGQYDILDGRVADANTDLNNITPAAGQPFNGAGGALNPGLSNTTINSDVVAVNLVKPAAGHTTTVDVHGGERLVAQFDPNSADLNMKGKDLVMSFNDGSKLVLHDFAQDSHDMPSIALPNGAIVAGGVIVAQLQGTTDIFNLETAAGAAGATGGGQFIYSDDLGSVIGLLNKLPPIPFTALQFGQPQPEVTINDLVDRFGGTTVTTFDTLAGVLGTQPGGFEDWAPFQNTGDYSEYPMAMNFTFTPNDNEVLDTVTISNIPAGVTFYYGTTGAYAPVPVIGGSVTFTAAQLASGQVFIKPPANSDVDIPLTVSANFHDPDSNQAGVTSQNVTAIIDAVADQPENLITSSISVSGGTTAGAGGTASGESDPGTTVDLNVKVDFPDNDGSEAHTVTINGVPSQWTLASSGGITFTAHDNGDGTFSYTATVGGHVNSVVSFNANGWTSDANGDAHMTLTATTTEAVTDGELISTNNTSTVTTTFNIHMEDDVPVIVAPITGANPILIPEHTLVDGINSNESVSSQIVVDYKSDGPGNVVLTLDGLAALGLTSHGETLSYALSDDGKTITATDTDGHTVFTIALGAAVNNGNLQTVPYTFTLHAPLDHPDGTSADIDNIPVHFTATDTDGDTANGSFTVGVVDDTPTAESAQATVDETNFGDGSAIFFPPGDGIHPVDGVVQGVGVQGDLHVNYNADGPGAVSGDSLFNASGSLAAGALTSNGHEVVVTFNNGVYTGATAAGAIVFTLSIDANGHYNFQQFETLDHANGSDPNDVINLSFGYQVTDFDGDTSHSTLTINVRDDAPVAHDDHNVVADGQTIATGNVITGQNEAPGGADQLSHDETNLLKDVTNGAITKSFSTPDGTDAGGKFVTLDGQYGTLKIYENGQYTYTYDTAHHTGGALDFGSNGHTPGDPAASWTGVNFFAFDASTAFQDNNGHLLLANAGHNGATVFYNTNGNGIGITSNEDPYYEFGQTPGSGGIDHSEALAVQLPISTQDAVIQLGQFYSASEAPDVHTEVAQWFAYDANGNLVGSGVISADSATLIDSVNGIRDFSIHTQSAFQYLVLKGLPQVPGTPDSTSGNGESDYLLNGIRIPNQDMSEHFTYTLVDGDGDTSRANLDFTIHDNGPGTAPSVEKSVDETTDINHVISDTINVSNATHYEVGGAGFSFDGSAAGGALTSHGVPVTVNVVNGEYVGTAGGTEVFRLTLNTNGSYSFVLKAPLDHADGSNPNDVINLKFTYAAKDDDGDTSIGNITVHVLDDAPLAVWHEKTRDETTDLNVPIGNSFFAGPAWEGQAQWGADGPGHAELDNHFVATKIIVANDTVFDAGNPNAYAGITSHGVPVVVTQIDANNYVGMAGNVQVFKFTIDNSEVGNPKWSFVLTSVLDHPNPANPNEPIMLNFGFALVDNDGDASHSHITVCVFDDAPIAVVDTNTIPDGASVAVGNVLANDTLSKDISNTIKEASFNGAVKSFTTPDGTDAGGRYILVNGQYGQLKLYENGNYQYTYDNAHNSGNHSEVFNYTLKDFDGDSSSTTLTLSITDNGPGNAPSVEKTVDETTDLNTTINGTLTVTGANHFEAGGTGFTSSGSIAGGHLTSNGTNVTVSLVGGQYVGMAGGTEVFRLTINADGTYSFVQKAPLDHADGSNPNDVINLNFTYAASDADGDTSFGNITVHVRDDAPVAVADTTSLADGQVVATGNVIANDVLSHDVPNTLQSASFGGVTKSFATAASDAGGKFVILDGTYGQLKIYQNGQYTYNYDSANHSGNHTEQFKYVLVDRDGDTSETTLTLSITDSVPGQAPNVERIVDETTDLNHTFTDTIAVAGATTFAMGTVTGSAAFTHNGSELNNQLTSNGVAVTVSLVGGQYVGMAGGTEVFRLSINNNGTYSFVQKAPLDHADGSNPNDIINLNFHYTARDSDGDASEGQITVHVRDDAPVAHDDVNTMNGMVATGNVISGLNGGPGAADTLSHDVTNLLKSVSFENTVKSFATDGHVDGEGKYVTITGNHGELKIYEDGHYTYNYDGQGGPNAFHLPTNALPFPMVSERDNVETHLTPQQEQILINTANSLQIDFPTTVSVDLVKSDGFVAGYGNGLGAFTLNNDGSISNVDLLFGNATANNTNPLSGNDLHATYNMTSASGRVVFFIIQDGFNQLKNLGLADATGHATDPNGRLSMQTQVDGSLKLVYTDSQGHITALDAKIYTSDPSFNADHQAHTIAGIAPGTQDVAQFGFEDLTGTATAGSDRDFNDVMFKVSVAPQPGDCNLEDQFHYVLQDHDGDTSGANLTFDIKACTAMTLAVNNGVDNVHVKEDGHVDVSVVAHYMGGNDNEVMTLTLTGVQAGWTVNGNGWVDQGNGTYKMTLAAGVHDFNGNITFAPPHNSDVDLTGLNVTASLYDPDTNATKMMSDGFNIQTDAVVDTPVLTTQADLGAQYWYAYGNQYTLPLHIASNVTDTDGSEKITKIVVHLENAFSAGVDPYHSLADMGVKLNMGTEVSPGVWEIAVNAQTAASLANLALVVPDAHNYYPIHQSLVGGHHVNITVESHVSEVNLSGVEYDTSDNSTVVIANTAFTFYITPLAMDLNGDGINVVNQDHGVMFDMNNNGTLDHTSWIAGTDALLALDKNGDHVINNQSELFGDDATHLNGFDNLASYDTNNDGVIDHNDAVFDQLVVWQDINQDGISQSNEMFSLTDKGIVSINVHGTESGQHVGDSVLTHTGSFSYADGHQGQVADVGFNVLEGSAADQGAIFKGTEQNDIIHGTERNDVFIASHGNDTLYGAGGADVFTFTKAATGFDTIMDYNSQEGDKLNISDLLTDSAYQPGISHIEDYVKVDHNTGQVFVDASGHGAFGDTNHIATISNISTVEVINVILNDDEGSKLIHTV